jgi:hypothetical protein
MIMPSLVLQLLTVYNNPINMAENIFYNEAETLVWFFLTKF